MKANEAPEKIYFSGQQQWSNPFIGLVQCADTDIEYTRTDAFIEKACEGIEHLLSGYIIRNFHFGDSYKIDTLIEDFKNYLKGE